MADLEFEEFCYFDEIPEHIKASTRTYTLVHDVVIDDDPSENSTELINQATSFNSCKTNDVFEVSTRNYTKKLLYCDNFSPKRLLNVKIERQKKEFDILPKKIHDATPSLADEFEHMISCDAQPYLNLNTLNTFNQRSSIAYLTHNIYSPDSEHCDSGNSTVHSPDDSLLPGSEDDSNSGSFTHLELLEATHRALYKFIARHSDEVELDIGDPIYVQKEAEDLWCEGINLRTGNRGIFPSAYVVDVEYNDFDPSIPQVKRERFALRYLGSVETLFHKGNPVLCQAIQKIMSTKHKKYSCILEVSDQGLKMYDGMKPKRDTEQTLDYFYSLKNVSFCGFHPQDSRLMGFITKHPRCDRFACHVFQSDDSTRPVTEAIGRAFQRFYQKYIETAYPIEDIYIE